MKVLIINTLYYPNIRGGAEKSTQLLAEGLQELGVEPVVVSTAATQGIGKVNGIKVYYLPLKNIYWPSIDRKQHSLLRSLWHFIDIYNPLMMKQVGAVIDLEHPDLVHTNNLMGFSVGIWKAVKNRGIPLIHTLRDYYLVCPRTTMFHNGNNCVSQCRPCRVSSYPKRLLSDSVDQVVGISSFILRRHLEAGFFSTSLREIIYNPVAEKKPNSSTNGYVRFGYIGRLGKYKGVEDVLTAFKSLESEKASLTLAGTGDSDYLSFLQKKYCCANISFLGFIPSDDFFSQVNVVIVPSHWHEPLGRVVLEAYSHGIPVIAAKRGGIPEIIEEGRTGFLFDPDDSNGLANHLRKFIKEPGLFKEMGRKSWKKSGDFSQLNISRQYLDLYKTFTS